MILGGDERMHKMISKLLGPEVGEDSIVALDFVKIPKELSNSKQKVLIRFEGPTSSPLSHNKDYVKKFNKVIDIGATVDLPWPITDANFDYIDTPLRQQKAAMILGNKISFSSQELYSLRRRIAFESNVELRGTGWMASMFSRIILMSKAFAVGALAGQVRPFAARYWFKTFPKTAKPLEDKWAFASQFQVAVVIENDTTRVTEKVFDALASGCYVVYSGSKALQELPTVILERVTFCAPDLGLLRDAITRALSQPWTAPSLEHASALKSHYANAQQKCLTQIAYELKNAKN